MIKNILKYLFVFCALLSVGYTYSSFEKGTEISQQAIHDAIYSHQSIIKQSLPDTEKSDAKFAVIEFENEEDDDRRISSKDYLSNSSYFTPIFHTQVKGNILNKSYKNHTCNSIPWYLIFQVFRL